MSFPRYPSYKPSLPAEALAKAGGVDWLGEVPAHWEVKRLKNIATHNDEVLDETTAPDTEIIYVDISGVDAVSGITAKEPMKFSAAPSRARRRVRHGDVIVSTVRTYLRAIARIRDPEENLIVSTGFAVVRPREALQPEFLGYLLSAQFFVDQVIARSTGVSYPAINASELVAITVSVPTLIEQTRIAEFLDRETAKIDELVAEQRRLMELLKEKRQAVISHAVTRGLNPQAPLKPSGIEWLGDVPAHWEIKRLHLVAGFESGMAHEPYVDDSGEFICVNSRFISTGGASRKFCTQNLSPAKKNDVLMVMSDLPNGRALAKAFFVSDDAPYAVNQRVGIISPTVAHPRFLYHYLDRNPGFLLHDDGLNQTHLWNDLFKKFPTPVPPLPEQEKIADFVDTELVKFDTLTVEAQRAIDLLQERRTALISAAVTGQIDVSSFAKATADTRATTPAEDLRLVAEAQAPYGQ